jgi:carbamoyltransferase
MQNPRRRAGMAGSKAIYVLGTGLSHDGSACLLKDGKIAVAIEKERLTRRKHDGWNDKAAMQYCWMRRISGSAT